MMKKHPSVSLCSAGLWLSLLSACGDKGPDTSSSSDDSGSGGGGDTATETPVDLDGDGSPAGEDCDDDDPLNRPGGTERCDGADNDCDGSPLPDEVDADSDGALDCSACDAAGYWPEAVQVSGDKAINALFAAKMGGVACTSYTSARSYLFGTLDNQGGQVEGLYTGNLYSYDPKSPDWDTVNTEHVWPRSQGAEDEPVECDLHHLFPADAQVNTLRGSLPFGEVSRADWSDPSGSLKGEDATGTDVFEPRDERKGDIARALLYIAARYPDIVERDAQRSAAQVALFQRWILADPVTDAELQRSLTIAALQGSANPFVVCPDLASRL